MFPIPRHCIVGQQEEAPMSVGGMGSIQRQTRNPGGPEILLTASLRVSVPTRPGMEALCLLSMLMGSDPALSYT